jgi:hypothetical protein
MKQIVLFFLMVCAFSSNAQLSVVITAEQPALNFNDSTETLVSVELSDYHRSGGVFTPIEVRRSNIQTMIRLGGIGLGVCTKFGGYEQFRFGGTLNIFPIGIRNNVNMRNDYDPEWVFAPTMNVNTYLSWDIVDNDVNRFGVKLSGEMDMDFLRKAQFSPGFNVRVGIYYALNTNAIFPMQMGCPSF